MSESKINRRRFLAQAGVAAAGTAAFSFNATAANAKPPVDWPIGCFNRPWGKFSYDDALDGLTAAGFKTTGIVGRHKTKPESLLTPDADADYLDRLKGRIAERGLKPIIAWIYGPKAKDHKGAVAELKKLTDNARQLGLETLLSGGPRRNETVEYYSGVISEVSAYAADQGIKIAMKPHGGDGAEITRCFELVDHGNFSLWYDAGNIIYYTGQNPVVELKNLASKVTGFCAKDCGGKGSPVMIQFGEGKVNFQRVFQTLKDAGFNGPVMIECTGESDSPEQATQLAIANRDFLKNVFAGLK
ncbi:MAG: sugar phosphate isomerase/epimerase [Limisphaerales bacterium]|jgi:sugar phosphate isomerase/epimerase